MRNMMAVMAAAAVLVPGCRTAQRGPDAQPAGTHAPQTISITNWTDKTELFLEYQPLATTAKRRFAVHFTNLADFKPVTKGSVTIALLENGAVAETFSTAAPSRPGIFGVDVQPKRAGKYAMVVSLNAPSLEDRHEAGEVRVYASEGEIPAAPEDPGEEHIAFLKEQQWTLDFATGLAAKRSMRESIVVSGDVRPRSGGEVEVAAPIAGRVSDATPLPVSGAAVERGQTLAAIVPLTPAPGDRPSLELAVSEARTALDLARRDLARAERLLAAGAIAAKRVDEAKAAEATAEARLATAEQRLRQFEASRSAGTPRGGEIAFSARAPIAGVVAAVSVSPGSNVTQGDRLCRIVAVDRVYVAANVPESEIPRVSRLSGAEIEVPGAAGRIPAARQVAKSSIIDPQSRTLSILFEVANPARTFAIGQTVSVRLFLTGSMEAVTVPDSALVDDGGRPVVFVQKEGEAFARRAVKPGIREGNLVQITEGLRAGERVVTKGAYLIRLAALSSQIPAHGHVH